MGVLTKLIAGLVMTVTLVRPLVTVRLTDLTQWSHEFDSDAARAVALGQTQTRKALVEFIIQRTQAYILDKAQALNTALEVEVTLSDDEIPIPVKVCLSGKVSPYAKGRLQQIISEELGIERENQIWT